MGLSQADLRLMAGFVRKVTKAPNVESVISETFKTLRSITGTKDMRIVYSSVPTSWNEWKAGARTMEVRPHDEWPVPSKKGLTSLFDPENEQAGYVSVEGNADKNRFVLEVLAPEIWAALLLQTALTRVQKAAMSETEMVRETLRARDEERRHIARELHDDLGQSMASLKLALKWAEDQARPKPGTQEIVKELSEAREDVGVMLNKIRDLSHTLYPRILDTLGLVAALKELAYQASRHSGIAIDCVGRGKSRPLEKEVAVALYRCCQEAISNALRHARATTLGIQVLFANGEIRVTVEDDGKGFDPRTLYDSNARMMSSGFWTIRQRMADLGGAFRVSTADGHGTVVELIVPYSTGKAHDRRKDKVTHR